MKLTVKAVRADILRAKANIPPMQDGHPSSVAGVSRIDLGSGFSHRVEASWVFHRGNPCGWKVWYSIKNSQGATTFSNTSADELARVFLRYTQGGY